MDSDAKKLGHVPVADRKTASDTEGWNVIIHPRIGNGNRNQNLPLTRVSVRVRHRPDKSALLSKVTKKQAAGIVLHAATGGASSLRRIRPFGPQGGAHGQSMPTREVHGLDDILLTGNLYDQRRTAQRLELIPDQVAANLFVFGVRYGDDIPPDFASEARLDPCPSPAKWSSFGCARAHRR